MKMKEKIEERIKNAEEELRQAKIELSNLKVEEVSIGDLVHYSGFDWYVIDRDEDKTTLFMKDKLQPEMIKKYFVMPDMVDGNYRVRFNEFGDNNWKNSYIRYTLNSQFLTEQFNINDLVKDDNDYVRLITKEEVEKLPNEIRRLENSEYGYWTKTSRSSYSSLVFNVYSSGDVDRYNFAHGTDGVRPVIHLKSNIQLKSNDEDFDRKNNA